MRLILTSLLILYTPAYAERSYIIESGSTRIHVIDFPSEQNSGFQLIDGGKSRSFVTDHYDASDHSFIVNGGYFDGNLNPVGICRIDGADLSISHADRLSGFLTLTDKGKLQLHWKQLPQESYRDILQAGPFIIDPGGELGIFRRTGGEARRTVIAETDDGRVLVLTTTEVYLYDLAKILKTEIPEVERALNLDGGPSVGLIYDDIKMKNPNPVRNFLLKTKISSVTSAHCSGGGGFFNCSAASRACSRRTRAVRLR